MLDELVKVIETLQARISGHGATLRENETRTRMALIDPLLTVLGWDTADPSLVTPEYDISGKRADYALLAVQGAPIVFLEAKRLDEPLSNHRSQVVAYASELGIKYPALTNGNEWEVYDNSKLVPIEQRRILNVSISQGAPHQTALQLLLLWRPNLATGEPVAALAPIAGLVQPPGPEKLPPPPPHAQNGNWTPILHLPDDVSWRNRPSAIRFPNGEERQIEPTKWKFVLVAVAEWLIQNGGITKDMCPIQLDSERHLVHTQPSHPNGKPFFFPAKLSNGLSIISRPTAKKAAESCTFLMKLCHQDPSQAYVRLGK